MVAFEELRVYSTKNNYWDCGNVPRFSLFYLRLIEMNPTNLYMFKDNLRRSGVIIVDFGLISHRFLLLLLLTLSKYKY